MPGRKSLDPLVEHRRASKPETPLMRRAGRVALIAVAIVVLAFAGFMMFAWQPEIEAQASVPSFEQAAIDHGAMLAEIGNCSSCHTTRNGPALAGGLAVPSQFGTIYSTNITPDAETGIGLWSEAAFRRAMREGLDREGNHLYPAFPYDHFTYATDEDIAAIYAYLMSQRAVSAEPPANELIFPLGFRPLVAGWKLLFFRRGAMAPDAARSEAWNRGRYLVEGLGHCAACHTPRNALGAEDRSQAYAGAMVEGWYAYPIGTTSPAPTPWTVESLTTYLHHGFVESHGTARGPMAEVTANLRHVADEDIEAIATYTASLMGQDAASADAAEAQTVPVTAEAEDPGALIYAAACSSCHDSGQPQPFGGLDLRRSTALHAETPQNVVNMVFYGLPAAEGEPGAVMAGYAGAISAEQMVALLDYMRATFTYRPAWTNTREIVDDTISGAIKPQIYSTDGVRRDPVIPDPRTTP
jgi:mono/diheme cytochrome c family protein